MNNPNTWIDLPVVEAMEYFGGIIGQAYRWANRYALIFGLIGLIWSGYKLVMSRMTVKDLWWDTLFKWVGFLVLMELYPTMTIGFNAIGTQIGLKAGGGQTVIIQGLKSLRNTIEKDLKAQQEWADGLSRELKSNFEGLTLTTSFKNSESYDDYLNKVSNEIGAYRFKSKNDKSNAKALVETYRDKNEFNLMFSTQTRKVLNKVLDEKKMDGSSGDNLMNSYATLDIFLRDANGDKTSFISPSGLFRVSLLSCQIMFEKEHMVFTRAIKQIDEREDKGLVDFSKMNDKLNAYLSRIPQMIMCIFSCFVLILATAFAGIQYVMTIIEYTIICGLGAIFIPLMLFDGTKDIPKKLIPVFTSFLVKIMVITICLMFVYYLMIENCINTIADDGGMNWVAVGEVFFEAILVYILTQNAPKISQTILTGQPQLSMGEAVQGAGTALATAGGMKAAASTAARKTYNGASTAIGEGKKMHAAAKAASGSLGKDATRGQKMKAAISGAGAVASADLKERTRARFEKFSKGHSSIPIADKALQMSGLVDSPSSSGGSGGAGGGANAHGITGQGKDGKAYSSVSNQSFESATKFDAKTQSQRAMTHKEFDTEKMRQGVEIGSQVGEKMKQKIDAQNQKKAEQGSTSSPLPESLTGNERPTK